MNCTNCGITLKDGSKFCASCGTKVDAPPAQQAQPVQTGAPAGAKPKMTTGQIIIGIIVAIVAFIVVFGMF